MGSMQETVVSVEGKEIKLTNMDKEFWPGGGLTKAHLVKYYTEMAPFILPYIRNRPLVMKRYPDGIHGHFFYQKECPSYAPDWVESYSIVHSRKIVNYVICNDTATLIWLANQGCIEVHAWLSTLENLECPDIAVMDLDPAEGTVFSDVKRVAFLVKRALEFYGLRSFIKTSGASGLHVFIPTRSGEDFGTVTEYMRVIAETVARAFPEKATVARSIKKRYGKVYLDYLQNGRGKTMAFPYSLRPLEGAPVSVPLRWDELSGISSSAAVTMHDMRERSTLEGDPWRELLVSKQGLNELGTAVTSIPIPGLSEGMSSMSAPAPE